MIGIKLINKIAKIGTDVFDKEKYTVSDNAENPVGLMVRSAKLHDTVFEKETIAIARAPVLTISPQQDARRRE